MDNGQVNARTDGFSAMMMGGAAMTRRGRNGFRAGDADHASAAAHRLDDDPAASITVSVVRQRRARQQNAGRAISVARQPGRRGARTPRAATAGRRGEFECRT